MHAWQREQLSHIAMGKKLLAKEDSADMPMTPHDMQNEFFISSILLHADLTRGRQRQKDILYFSISRR